MKRILLVFAVYLITVNALAQEVRDTNEIETIDEVLISAQRLGAKRAVTSRQIEVITAKQMELAMQPTMAEVLSQSGQVFVQKSQLGGGSPVLRGFEASRVLLVVDGVRMNNATYRAGHLQDIITVDQFMLDRTEVFFGSGSTQYGSDALGGVIYMKTKDPKFRDHKFGLASANINMRYMSAGNAWVRNINTEFSGKKVAWLFSGTFSEFGDLRTGQQRNYSAWDTFGMRNRYVDRLNGRDTMLPTEDPFVQRGSAYNQFDLFSKLAVKTGNLTHILNTQLSISSIISRYDRLQDVRNNALRFARWDYAPQNRSFISYTLLLPESEKLKHRIILSNQTTEVGRVTRTFRSANELTQKDNVNMAALNYDLSYQINEKLQIQGGAEVVHNTVKSVATDYNVNTDIRTDSKNTRYADGGANTLSAAVFANVIYAVKPDDFIIEGGFRLSHYSLNASFSPDNFLKLPYDKAELRTLAPVYNLGIIKKMDIDGLFFKSSIASGFRNPNVDDMTKLFESVSGLKLVIPNNELKPERTRTFDMGISYDGKKSRFEFGGYYTRISQLLIDGRSTYNGSDSILFDGKMTPVFQMANTAGGYVTGAYFAGKINLISKLFAEANYTSTFGRYRTAVGSAWVPLDHIAPDHGRVGLRWAASEWQCEAFMLFNGRKVRREYSPSGEDNPQYAPGGQTPAWQTYNFRASWKADKHLTASLAVENILDLHYRVFSGGISAPGRNLVLSVKVSI